MRLIKTAAYVLLGYVAYEFARGFFAEPHRTPRNSKPPATTPGRRHGNRPASSTSHRAATAQAK